MAQTRLAHYASNACCCDAQTHVNPSWTEYSHQQEEEEEEEEIVVEN